MGAAASHSAAAVSREDVLRRPELAWLSTPPPTHDTGVISVFVFADTSSQAEDGSVRLADVELVADPSGGTAAVVGHGDADAADASLQRFRSAPPRIADPGVELSRQATSAGIREDGDADAFRLKASLALQPAPPGLWARQQRCWHARLPLPGSHHDSGLWEGGAQRFASGTLRFRIEAGPQGKIYRVDPKFAS
jgi:hypothetical protein